MYVIRSGHAELIEFPGNNEYLEKEAEAIRRQISDVNGLSLGFTLCARAMTMTTGGYREEHPPLCPVLVAGMEQDLERQKSELRDEILRTARPEVQAYLSLDPR